MTFDSKEYYQTHKETMIKQIMEAKKRRRREIMIIKLNDGSYGRVPHSALLRHNIVFNKETNLYE